MDESKFNYSMFHSRSSLIWKWILVQTLEALLNCAEHFTCQLYRGGGGVKMEAEKREAKPYGRQFESRQLVSAVAQFDLTLWKMFSGALIV